MYDVQVNMSIVAEFAQSIQIAGKNHMINSYSFQIKYLCENFV